MIISAERKQRTRKMVLGAIMTAFVIVLQSIASMTTFFGPFSSAVALIPIVIGAAMCGTAVGTWLGIVFGAVVLLTGGANLFLPFSVQGTLITVLVKGAACGFMAGIVYNSLKKFNEYVAAIAAAIVCPITNTGVFLLGCSIFFMKHDQAIAAEAGVQGTGIALFLAFAMANFVLELVSNILLSPIFIRVLKFAKKQN